MKIKSIMSILFLITRCCPISAMDNDYEEVTQGIPDSVYIHHRFLLKEASIMTETEFPKEIVNIIIDFELAFRPIPSFYFPTSIDIFEHIKQNIKKAGTFFSKEEAISYTQENGHTHYYFHTSFNFFIPILLMSNDKGVFFKGCLQLSSTEDPERNFQQKKPVLITNANGENENIKSSYSDNRDRFKSVNTSYLQLKSIPPYLKSCRIEIEKKTTPDEDKFFVKVLKKKEKSKETIVEPEKPYLDSIMEWAVSKFKY